MESLDSLGERGLSAQQEQELLALLLEEEGFEIARPARIPARPPGAPAPLSFAQERLWFLYQLAPLSPAYNIAAAISITGHLQVALLRRSFDAVARRQEILRTTFTTIDGDPAQVIGGSADIPVVCLDLRGLPVSDRQALVARIALAEARRPFDLASGPLVRIVLARTGDAEQVMLLTLHHIIADGWSVGILVQELAAFYNAFASAARPALPELPIQYADFAIWQRAQLRDAALDRLLDYWRRQLEDCPTVLALPADRPRPTLQTFQGAQHHVALPGRLTDELNRLSQAAGTTLFVTLLSALNALLYRYTGQEDILVGAPVAGRGRAELEGLIGFFVNLLAVRARCAGDLPFHDLLGQVRATVVAAQEHQELPFERIVEALRVERDLGRHPLVQVVLALQNAPMPPLAFGDLTLRLLPVDNKTAKFDLLFDLTETDAGLEGWIEYNTDLFDATTIARMCGHFAVLLEGIVDHPDARVTLLPLLPEAERWQVLHVWNATARPYPADECIHQRFVAQAMRAPEAIALVYQDLHLSYRALDARANHLAHELWRLGVGPEKRVGVCLERSPDLVIVLLAVLKAGGAYVPLDPTYPRERLSMMLQDASVSVLITREHLSTRLPEHDARVVALRPALWTDMDQTCAPPTCRATGRNLAYVLFTSGSTGRPKGVAIEHRSVAALLAWAERIFPAADRAGVLATTSVCFDLSIFELFVPLCLGGMVILADNILQLPVLPALDAVTLINTVPSAMRELLREGRLPRAVRTVNLAGEPLATAIVQQIYAQTAARRVLDLYGPSEDTTYSTWAVRAGDGPATIGRPIDNTQVYLLDASLQPVPVGVAGELYLGGAGLARGYLDRPDLTAARFVPDPFGEVPGARLYRSGDLARYRADGQIEYLGRIDQQVKIRGFRIEPAEVAAALARHPAVRETAVLARADGRDDTQLVAYVVPREGETPDIGELRHFLRQQLPEYMVPSAFVVLDTLPLTPNGKLNRRALPTPDSARPDTVYVSPQTALEQTIAAAWQAVLGIEQVGRYSNFFDLGGQSLLMMQVRRKLCAALDRDISMVDLFKYPTVHSLARYLAHEESPAPSLTFAAPRGAAVGTATTAIAIVGMAGRFPGAGTIDEFWANLRDGVESVSFFSDDELVAAGIAPGLLRDPRYVKARAYLEGADLFDAEFFGFTHREAEITDPQQRLFLECAWEAIEHAGYDPETYPGTVGVYAGAEMSAYLHYLYSANPDVVDAVGQFQTVLGNDKDYLPTRVSYKLNLRGPSVSVQTACSTSLVAVHLACQSLLNGECTLALAGGVSIAVPQKAGYLYQPGGIRSDDGHCRAFDAGARGFVDGDGVGIVVLKRLDDALADGDTIYGVIRGTAINNDGALKAGFTAPSVQGQSEVIAAAYRGANVDPTSVTYIEAHGTGTPIGDPIEVSALTEVFGAAAQRPGGCAIGSVKTNIGHLGAAAGVAGLIKTALALRLRQIPPSLHFERPSPEIDFARSPFYVNRELAEWRVPYPRRAGVSSFGIGGTNAHVVLEEAPPVAAPAPARPWQLLILSARTAAALDTATANLAAHLRRHPDLRLADVAYTLQVGRRAFAHRRAVVCRDAADAVSKLDARDPQYVRDAAQAARDRPVVFLFPGQGAQYTGMARELYADEPRFRAVVDRCAELLEPHLGRDIRAVLYPGDERPDDRGGVEPLNSRSAPCLDQTRYTQPALFVVAYALAQLWIAWGVRPRAMLGHSVGEYVAACLSGVLSLEDALCLVAARGRLMDGLPAGAMLSVSLGEQETRQLLSDQLDLAAVNGPSSCVVSGEIAAIERLERELAARGIVCRRLRTSHAFHSSMMAPIVERFAAQARGVRLHPPETPFISNVTGSWVTAEQAVDPAYWARHLRETVRFADGVERVLQIPDAVLLEVGPGTTLGTLVRQRPERSPDRAVVSSLRHPRDQISDTAYLMDTLGQLWLAGVGIDWRQVQAGEGCRRVALPTYPFERRRYWVEPARPAPTAGGRPPAILPGDAESPATIAAALPPRPDRRARIVEALKAIVYDLSGIDPAALDARTPFFELGFDSLIILQFSQAIRERLGVDVTLRQLFEDLQTVHALAVYLDGQLPPEPGTPPPTAQDVPPSVVGQAPATPAELEQLLAQQVAISTRLLELLRGDGARETIPQAIVPAPLPRELPPPSPAAPAPYIPYQPATPGPSGDLSEQQQQYLDRFIARYTRRTRESKRQTQDGRAVLADNRAAARFRLLWKEILYPIVGRSSAGARLWDADGNEYVDLALGFGVNLFGHAPAFVTAALTEQLQRGMQLGPQSELAAAVARMICELAGVERVTFCNSGTEAVMVALRQARTVTRRRKVVLFAGAYHGTFDGILARGVASGEPGRAVPMAPGIPPGMVDDVLVLEYGAPEALAVIRARAHELAAVLVEPVQSRRPDLQPRAFLHELREVTARSGTALIFDEVITGFRIHPGGAQAWFGVQADLVTYGKILGGGMPIGVVAGRSAFMDAIDGGMWQYGDDSFPRAEQTFFAGTFCKHPLTMAAAHAVLTHLKEQGPALQQRLNEQTAGLARALNAFFERERVPIRMVHFGSLFRFTFPAELKFADLFLYHMLEKGVYIWEGGTCFLSTAHTEEDVARVIGAVEQSVAEMREGDFLPAPAPEAAAEPIAPASRRAIPTTEAQKEVWIASQMSAESAVAYHQTLMLRLLGPLDLPALRRALHAVGARHEALRVTFSPDGEYQYIDSAPALDVPLIDFSAMEPASRGIVLDEWLSRAVRQLFDLERGPLARVRVIRLGAREHIFAMIIHHIVIDTWSLDTLTREVAALYSAERRGIPPELPEPMPYSAYAARQVELERGGAMARTEAYWLGQFEDAIPTPELPTDRPRAPARGYNSDLHTVSLDAELSQALRRLSVSQGCTLFMTFLAAFSIVMERLTGRRDFVIGIHSAGQPSVQGRSLVGLCINVLPLRIRISGQGDFAAHLAEVKRKSLEAYEHQAYSFGRLIRRRRQLLDPTRVSLLPVVFNLDRAGSGISLSGLEVEDMTGATGFAAWDVGVNIIEGGEKLVIEWKYNTDLFDLQTIRRWTEMYLASLRAAVDQPAIHLNKLKDLLADAEKQYLAQQADDLKSARLQKFKQVRRKMLSAPTEQEAQ